MSSSGKTQDTERFAFGHNWASFLKVLDEERVIEAERSLKTMLGVARLDGKTFLDVGSGSGLFSLAARRLGARVHSFDYDPQSVACTAELRRRYLPDDDHWRIEQGSVLDRAYLGCLGQFDVVYAWGVLHHTGTMWQAMENVTSLVQPGGRLFLAIYNDQGGWSRAWSLVKRVHNRLPGALSPMLVFLIAAPIEARALLLAVASGRPLRYVHRWTRFKSKRGMSRWHDLVDWVGGYPFEVAKPEDVFRLYRDRGFVLIDLKTCGGGLGNNEYVFLKSDPR